MKNVFIGLLAFGLTTQAYSQIVKTEQLSEVTVVATNYKYLSDMNSKEVVSVPVQMLQRKVAAFDVRSSDFYQDDYDLYNITFYIPEGKVLAAYDKDGKIIRTVERFKDINIPAAIKKAVLDRFPEWTISKDVYRVNYNDKKGSKKTYKLTLENGDKTLKVKTDEEGNFIS